LVGVIGKRISQLEVRILKLAFPFLSPFTVQASPVLRDGLDLPVTKTFHRGSHEGLNAVLEKSAVINI
jgi:hypothetical protein